MHFVFLVEDDSGKVMLETLVPKVLSINHSYEFHSYKGIGSIPRDLRPQTDANKRILLDQLPRLLKGYGNTYANIPNYPYIIIVVCDLDNRCLHSFRQELLNIVDNCSPKPNTAFCIAIEEMEAWLLGDIEAIKKAYPKADNKILASYVPDSICGTWEKLADATCKGGHEAVKQTNPGTQKHEWAQKICPNMDVTNNNSPSFNYFRTKLLNAAGNPLAAS